MAKEPKDETPKQTVWQSKATVCQCCSSQSNKPSTCSAYNKSVGRKQDASKCKKFKRTK